MYWSNFDALPKGLFSLAKIALSWSVLKMQNIFSVLSTALA
jgi:hypothetical protein